MGVPDSTLQGLGRRIGVRSKQLNYGGKGSTSFERDSEVQEELTSLTVTGEVGM